MSPRGAGRGPDRSARPAGPPAAPVRARANEPAPMRVLLVTPPMVQFNAPYAATPMLTAWLRSLGHDARQADLSLALALRLFSRRGLAGMIEAMGRRARRHGGAGPSVRHVLDHADACLRRVGPALRYLQNRAPGLAPALARDGWLPEGPRFRTFHALRPDLPEPDLARHRASLFLDDLADAIRDGVDARFELARYGERLASPAASFDPLAAALRAPPSPVDRMLDDLAARCIRANRPRVLGLTIPFPGAVYGALRIARVARRIDPRIVTVAGGGFVNTELRDIVEPRFFRNFDYLLYDDGERPLERLLAVVEGREPASRLLRARHRARGRVVWTDAGDAPALRHRDRPAPVHDGLPLDRYPGLAETPNPMQRLWSERRWNRLMLAHGCYWRRCRFCDTSLDYIRRFDPADAATVRRWVTAVVRETGSRGFHFVDEAAPPALLRHLSVLLARRGPPIEWWTNVRFEPVFDEGLCTQMRRAGCLAVTGGLETAADRSLRRMCKGITVDGAASALRAFAAAGIRTHAYLMYGFPGQTPQEVVDALERVRRLFARGWLQSAYWHRFALTVHSGVYRARDAFGLVAPGRGHPRFASNEVRFRELGRRGDPYAALASGLRTAAFNFMLGIGLDEDVRGWFGVDMPRPRVPARWPG